MNPPPGLEPHTKVDCPPQRQDRRFSHAERKEIVLPKVRIVLVEFAGILREVVRSALDDRETKIVAELSDPATLADALRRSRAHVVLWRIDHSDISEPVRRLLDDHPRLKFLVLEEDGRRGFLWEMRPKRSPLGELSPSLLVDVLRRAVTE